MQTVVETSAFLSDARSLRLSDAERSAIVLWIAAYPAAGDVIEGTGGEGKGKSGGYRVITFFTRTEIPVFLLNIFAKNEKIDLTSKEHHSLKTVLADIVKTYRSKRESK